MISRPCALIGFSFTLALLVLNLFDGGVTALVAFALCGLAVCAFGKGVSKRGVYAAFMLSVLLACACFSWHTAYAYRPSLSAVGEEKRVLAQIVSLPEESNGNYGYTLAVKQIDGEPFSGKLWFVVEEPLDAEPYDELLLTCDLKHVETAGKGMLSYYKAKKIFWCSYSCSEYSITPCEVRPIGYYFLAVKSFIVNRLNSLMNGDAAGLCVGMLTGDTSGLSDKAYADFKATGLSHVLSVSGLHMSVIVLSLYKFLGRLFRRFAWLPPLICIVVAVAYAGVTGFSQSVVRSCIMVCMLFAGRMFWRRADTLNSLGLAALLITFYNPFAAVDWSFMLSFSATLGIVLAAKPISSFSEKCCEKIKHKLLADLLGGFITACGISISATAFCLPVTVFFIGSASTVFLPANILTMYAASAVLILSLFCLAPVGPIANLISGACAVLCRYILALVNQLAQLPHALVKIESDFAKISVILALSVIAVIWLLVKNRRRFTVLVSAVLSLAMVLSIGFTLVTQPGRVYVTVAQGCIVFTQAYDAVVIAGNGQALEAAGDILYEKGAENVTLVLPMLQADETQKDVNRFFNSYNVKKLFLTADNSIKSLAQSYEVAQIVSFAFYDTKIICTQHACYTDKGGESVAVIFDKTSAAANDYVINMSQLTGEGSIEFYFNKNGELKGGEEIGSFKRTGI